MKHDYSILINRLKTMDFSLPWNFSENSADADSSWFENIYRRLEKINFSDNWSEYYKPVKSEITYFSKNETEYKWLTQFHYGCLFFALMNGNFIDQRLKIFFDFNLDFSHPIRKGYSEEQKVIGVVHEYKAILLFRLLTGIGKFKVKKQKSWMKRWQRNLFQ